MRRRAGVAGPIPGRVMSLHLSLVQEDRHPPSVRLAQNSADVGNTIEEIYDSGFEAILGTDDQKPISLNQLLQDL